MGAEGSTGSRGCWHRLLWGHPEKQQHCLGTAGGSSQWGASVKPHWVEEHVERDRGDHRTSQQHSHQPEGGTNSAHGPQPITQPKPTATAPSSPSPAVHVL